MQQRIIKIRAQHRLTKEWKMFILPRDLFIAREDQIGDYENYGESTDLLDRNGKEIYEGDIITGVYGWSEAIFEVRWDLYGFRLRCVRDFFCGPKNDIVYAAKDQWIDCPTHIDLCEVIGNIHENPDLLEKAAPTSTEA